jgi:hypothetical protein
MSDTRHDSDARTVATSDDQSTETAATATRSVAGDDWQIGPAESRVPADYDGPVADCPYCGRPFETERARTLHVVESHSEEATDEERAAYEEADAAEREELFVYHIKAVVAIGLTWAAFVVLYMVAIGSNIV